jgi:hypothetical protein
MSLKFRAQADHAGRGCIFYQSVAMPEKAVKLFSKENQDFALIKKSVQWRIDQESKIASQIRIRISLM